MGRESNKPLWHVDYSESAATENPPTQENLFLNDPKELRWGPAPDEHHYPK